MKYSKNILMILIFKIYQDHHIIICL